MALVEDALRADGAPGAAAAIMRDGHLAWAAGVGSSSPTRDRPLPTDACCYIYSITKLLLAALTLQLVEQGQVGLDVAIQAYLPDLPLATPVSVRQLLNHTGGLPDYGAAPEYAAAVRAQPGRPWTADEFLARTLARGQLFTPGTGWAYSNIGYLIIKQLLERVTGLSLRAVVERQFATPLGLRATVIAESLEDARVLTSGYSAFFSADTTLQDSVPLYHPGWVAHGVAISTAGELARLVDAILNGQLLSSASLASMLTPVRVPHAHPLFREPSYGLGVMLDPRAPRGQLAGHGGGGPGFATGALAATDAAGRRVTAVALVNHDRGETGLRIAHVLMQP
jgi:D-alanyl-D-alanine carboxypeptidase